MVNNRTHGNAQPLVEPDRNPDRNKDEYLNLIINYGKLVGLLLSVFVIVVVVLDYNRSARTIGDYEVSQTIALKKIIDKKVTDSEPKITKDKSFNDKRRNYSSTGPERHEPDSGGQAVGDSDGESLSAEANSLNDNHYESERKISSEQFEERNWKSVNRNDNIDSNDNIVDNRADAEMRGEGNSDSDSYKSEANEGNEMRGTDRRDTDKAVAVDDTIEDVAHTRQTIYADLLNKCCADISRELMAKYETIEKSVTGFMMTKIEEHMALIREEVKVEMDRLWRNEMDRIELSRVRAEIAHHERERQRLQRLERRLLRAADDDQQ